MIVLRKFFGTILWFFLLSILMIIVMTIYVLTQVDFSGTEAQVTAESERIATALADRYGVWMFYGPAGLALAGSILGWLPFTRHNRNR